jgi:hypothetical protein
MDIDADQIQHRVEVLGFLDVKVERSVDAAQRLNDLYSDPEVSNIRVSLDENYSSSGREPAEGVHLLGCRWMFYTMIQLDSLPF